MPYGDDNVSKNRRVWAYFPLACKITYMYSDFPAVEPHLIQHFITLQTSQYDKSSSITQSNKKHIDRCAVATASEFNNGEDYRKNPEKINLEVTDIIQVRQALGKKVYAVR